MSLLRAALIGFVVVMVMEVGFSVGLMLVAQASGWTDINLTLGSLRFLEIHNATERTSIVIGTGISLIAIAAGVLNAAGAYWLRRAEE
jgi:hypothetical protein